MGTTYPIVGFTVSQDRVDLFRVRVKQVAYLIYGFHIPLLLLLVIGSSSRNAIIVCHVPYWHTLADRWLSSGILTRAVCENRTIIFVVRQQLLNHAFTWAASHSTNLSLRSAEILLLTFEILGRTLVRHVLLLCWNSAKHCWFGLWKSLGMGRWNFR